MRVTEEGLDEASSDATRQLAVALTHLLLVRVRVRAS